jgi:hypothetical protein
MGILSKNAGVLGGIGHALSNMGAQKREERLQALQYDREMAIRKMEQEFQAGEKQKDRTHDASEGSKDRQQRVGDSMRADDRARNELESREREGEKDRQSRKEIAKIEADSRMGAAATRGNKKRFTINKVANETMTKEGGMSKTEDIVLTDHNNSGLTYRQQGDVFVPQGATPRFHANRQAAEARLREQPETVDDFVQKFGYLPAWFMKQQAFEVSSTDDEE